MNRAISTQTDPAPSTALQLARRAARTLTFAMIASAACLPALAAQLVPSRNTAAPGESVRITVNPPLNATMPAGARLFVTSEDRRGPSTELRIAEWRGDSFLAVLPCNANYEDASGLLLLTREHKDGLGGRVTGVLATSAPAGVRSPLFRVKTEKGANCAGRLQPDAQAPSATRGAASGSLSSRPTPKALSPAATAERRGDDATRR